MGKVVSRKFIAYFHFVGWDCFSLGLHVCLRSPNIEIHLPFGFIRVGWQANREISEDKYVGMLNRTFGIKPDNKQAIEEIRQAFAEEEEKDII